MLGLSSSEGRQVDKRSRVVALIITDRYILMKFIIKQREGSRDLDIWAKTQL